MVGRVMLLLAFDLFLQVGDFRYLFDELLKLDVVSILGLLTLEFKPPQEVVLLVQVEGDLLGGELLNHHLDRHFLADFQFEVSP